LQRAVISLAGITDIHLDPRMACESTAVAIPKGFSRAGWGKFLCGWPHTVLELTLSEILMIIKHNYTTPSNDVACLVVPVSNVLSLVRSQPMGAKDCERWRFLKQ